MQVTAVIRSSQAMSAYSTSIFELGSIRRNILNTLLSIRSLHQSLHFTRLIYAHPFFSNKRYCCVCFVYGFLKMSRMLNLPRTPALKQAYHIQRFTVLHKLMGQYKY
ncbi:hypothetical protein OCU04_004556 [Sclerotinia nivalis]|uniref:Uncharacterized protein n=1 Tax=Sclerotinia nivalis TaxID=352851 RepID=A0A9X0AQN6_9HELO|nr:hypothetical protein OCU04_004556 [Sclerotinia nivalis]